MRVVDQTLDDLAEAWLPVLIVLFIEEKSVVSEHPHAFFNDLHNVLKLVGPSCFFLDYLVTIYIKNEKNENCHHKFTLMLLQTFIM